MSVDLTSTALEVEAGLDLLDESNDFIEDISADLVPVGSSVKRSNYATLHGSCVLKLNRIINWEFQRLRPSVTITDLLTGDSQSWNLGVFLPETPKRMAFDTPQVYDIEGYDLLTVLRTPHGSSYRVAAGAYYVATVEALIAAAGESSIIDQTRAASTLPTDRVWPISEENTTLRIINDLLASINYRSLYTDRDGNFASELWESPTTRGAVASYDTSNSIIEDLTEETDLFDIPNKWIFVRNDPGQAIPSEGAGLYTVTNLYDGITSVDGRKRTITRVALLDAASQSDLVARGDRIVEEDKEPSQKVTIKATPNPDHWHGEVFTLNAPEVGVTNDRFTETSWTLPLDGGSTMRDGKRVK